MCDNVVIYEPPVGDENGSKPEPMTQNMGDSVAGHAHPTTVKEETVKAVKAVGGAAPLSTPVKPKVVSTYKSCHSGNKLAFEVDGVSFYGGGLSRQMDPNMVDLVVNLTGSQTKFSAISCLGFVPVSIGKWMTRKEIVIDMPDFGILPYPREFFEDLLAEIFHMKGRKSIKVLVCCQGGHGRTGTVLAILAGILQITKDPIGFIRGVYCDECVESWEQIDYIHDITDCSTEGHKPRSYTTTTTAYTPQPYGNYAPPKKATNSGSWEETKHAGDKEWDWCRQDCENCYQEVIDECPVYKGMLFSDRPWEKCNFTCTECASSESCEVYSASEPSPPSDVEDCGYECVECPNDIKGRCDLFKSMKETQYVDSKKS